MTDSTLSPLDRTPGSDSDVSGSPGGGKQLGLCSSEILLLWGVLAMWLLLFLAGMLVNSEAYRSALVAFEDGFWSRQTVTNLLAVVATYTYTNTAILCILSGLLGGLGAKAILVVPDQGTEISPRDTTSPFSSTVLRSFLLYLTITAGVLLLGDEPGATSQAHYVKLSGVISLLGFIINYRPALFDLIVQRANGILAGSAPEPKTARVGGR